MINLSGLLCVLLNIINSVISYIHSTLIWLLFLFAVFSSCSNHSPAIILNKPGYPLIFELKRNQSIILDSSYNNAEIKLIDIELFNEPNLWLDDTLPKHNYFAAIVKLKINDTMIIIPCRPYQMPVTVSGLRLYIEGIKQWNNETRLGEIDRLTGDVRLAVRPAGYPWFEKAIVFPVADYVWRASAYYNTWHSLVPYNLRYYHRGEDFGAIPGQLFVIAPTDGMVIKSPLPAGDGRSNTLQILSADSIEYSCSHMDIESIVPSLIVGSTIRKGDTLGKTGMTWSGKKSQVADPHLHFSARVHETEISLFPAVIESYFNTYPDAVLAIAGGYRFALPGQEILVDGTRSVARKEDSILHYEWELPGGTTVKRPLVKFVIGKPGLYSALLKVTTLSGAVDRDFLQIRVFDLRRKKNITYGWIYHSPVRNIHRGDTVTIVTRLMNVIGAIQMDAGDGSPVRTINSETYHIYNEPGNYVVTVSATGPAGEPVTLQMEIKVQ